MRSWEMRQALRELGVRDDTLSREEKGRLDRDGFLPLPGILSRKHAERLGARLDELIAQGESVQHQDSGRVKRAGTGRRAR